MSIVRVKHNRDVPYLIILKSTVLDGRLSFAERGFLIALLSLPDDWALNLRDLSRRFEIGINTVSRYLKKYEKTGFCEITMGRASSGMFEADYTVLEKPVTKTVTGHQSPKTGHVNGDILSINKPNKGGVLDPGPLGPARAAREVSA